jgi:hypothetical protein
MPEQVVISVGVAIAMAVILSDAHNVPTNKGIHIHRKTAPLQKMNDRQEFRERSCFIMVSFLAKFLPKQGRALEKKTSIPTWLTFYKEKL